MIDLKKLEKQSKADILAVVEQYNIEDITIDNTKKEMIASLEVALAKTEQPATEPTKLAEPTKQDPVLTDEDKTQAVLKMISTKPEIVLAPAHQAVMRIAHPSQVRKFYEINVFSGKLGSKTLDVKSAKPALRDPGPEESKAGFEVNANLLSDAPAWAYPQIYDFVASKDLLIFEGEEELQKLAKPQRDRHASPMFDQVPSHMVLSLEYDSKAGLRENYTPLIVSKNVKFKQQEQTIAWNAINETINGERPVPEKITADPRSINPDEMIYVRDRIERAIHNPESFLQGKRLVGSFNTRVFLDQLLACEYKGFTPRRVGGRETGGTRPAIIKVIRAIAKDNGFDVVGDYVRPVMETVITQDLTPNMPLTMRNPNGMR